ncbi:MAG TPA: Fe2+-dependent dioxygenase [Caulobacteraceae bacterium]|jgi:PKHD-type hydroxylase|nr:Fe2+-dependent dioxygenase [Caulobacteraceae bacterium]
MFFLEIDDVLTQAEVQRLRAWSRGGRFADGRISSPHSTVKNNLQIDHADPVFQESSRLMAGALQRCEAFQAFAFPRRFAPPMLAKYAPGMNYGFHSDAAFMAVGETPLRSDLSCTLFIAEPSAYEGGELCIRLGTREILFKGAAGSTIVYPSTTLHQVTPVTAGERLVGLTFIESRIPDPVNRELLWQLDEVYAAEGLQMSWENRTRLQYVRNSLLRTWSERG